MKISWSASFRRFRRFVVFVVFIVDSLQRGFPFVLEVSEDCLLQNILRLCQIFSFGPFGHDSVQIFFCDVVVLVGVDGFSGVGVGCEMV